MRGEGGMDISVKRIILTLVFFISISFIIYEKKILRKNTTLSIHPLTNTQAGFYNWGVHF